MSESAVQDVPATEVPAAPVPVVRRLSPFELMDRLDDELVLKELEGIESTELVYSITEGGKEVRNLSKVGVDECCVQLAHAGEPIRELECKWEMMGDPNDATTNPAAVFFVTAARYAVSPNGTEVKLDQVIGSKRQPLYYEAAAPMHVDQGIPGKKWRGKSWRDALATEDGRNYVAWIADNFKEEKVRAFAKEALSGNVTPMEVGPQLNTFWFEQGSMKAARNARYRLVPARIRARVRAQAARTGKVKTVDGDGRPVDDGHGEPQNQFEGHPTGGAHEPHPDQPALEAITRESIMQWGRFEGTAIKDLAFNVLEWGACVGKYQGQERNFGPRTREWTQAMKDEIAFREQEAERRLAEEEEDRLRREGVTAQESAVQGDGTVPLSIGVEATGEVKPESQA